MQFSLDFSLAGRYLRKAFKLALQRLINNISKSRLKLQNVIGGASVVYSPWSGIGGTISLAVYDLTFAYCTLFRVLLLPCGPDVETAEDYFRSRKALPVYIVTSCPLAGKFTVNETEIIFIEYPRSEFEKEKLRELREHYSDFRPLVLRHPLNPRNVLVALVDRLVFDNLAEQLGLVISSLKVSEIAYRIAISGCINIALKDIEDARKLTRVKLAKTPLAAVSLVKTENLGKVMDALAAIGVPESSIVKIDKFLVSTDNTAYSLIEVRFPMKFIHDIPRAVANLFRTSEDIVAAWFDLEPLAITYLILHISLHPDVYKPYIREEIPLLSKHVAETVAHAVEVKERTIEVKVDDSTVICLEPVENALTCLDYVRKKMQIPIRAQPDSSPLVYIMLNPSKPIAIVSPWFLEMLHVKNRTLYVKFLGKGEVYRSDYMRFRLVLESSKLFIPHPRLSKTYVCIGPVEQCRQVVQKLIEELGDDLISIEEALPVV